jgi:hypothetical protein
MHVIILKAEFVEIMLGIQVPQGTSTAISAPSVSGRICRAANDQWTTRILLCRSLFLTCWTSMGSTPWMTRSVRTASSARCRVWEGSQAGTSSRKPFGTWRMSKYSYLSLFSSYEADSKSVRNPRPTVELIVVWKVTWCYFSVRST